jgi:halimadienyl-diphosphate synthase
MVNICSLLYVKIGLTVIGLSVISAVRWTVIFCCRGSMCFCNVSIEETGRAVTALVADIASDAEGIVSPSVYETARVVTCAPWLGGHRQRMLFLLDRQHRDGQWGGPDGYGLVPTLSATEALLSSLQRGQGGSGWAVDYGDMVSAVNRGLGVLFDWLGAGSRVLAPDTVAAEIIIPSLIEQINAHLNRLEAEPICGLDLWRGSARLLPPSGMDTELLAQLRHRMREDQALSPKLWHSLEALGPSVRGAPFIHPVQGAVGCSPAATAAWLDDEPDQGAVRYLEAVQCRGGGPVPGVIPITVFERAWVLAALLGAGIRMEIPAGLAGGLQAACGEFGASAGAGLPPDADDTAGVVWVLAQLGRSCSVQSLWTYEVGPHFSCFIGERTSSTSTNAHVLQAFGAYVKNGVSRYGEYSAAMDRMAGWLRERQEIEGNWWDKWHASPYYATACCAVALHRYRRDTSAGAVSKAVEWLLDSQRGDGSWGRWVGTYEETAYAVQTLLQTRMTRAGSAREQAVARGCAFLLRWIEAQDHPPLWHDKDLYTPTRVVRAEGAAALHLALTDPQVVAEVRLLCTGGLK